MLITAYVFIGQQSHMSDMPLLHVICTAVKGNWYCLPGRLIMAAGSGDNCFICVLTDVYLLVWISLLRCDRIIDSVNRAELGVLGSFKFRVTWRSGIIHSFRIHEHVFSKYNMNTLPVTVVY